MEEKELFEDYEIKSWDFSPRLLKMFAAGTLAVFTSVFVFGQFNLMQSRACDTNYIGKVCQVLDAVYVAATFAGNDNEWVSKDYNKETIQDADITYIDVSKNEPPLKYPEGYFALANPEQFNSQMSGQNGDVMGMPFPNNPAFPPTTPSDPNAGNDMLNQAQVLPNPNNDALKGKIPDSPFSFGDDNPAPKFPPVRRPGPPRRNPPPRPNLSNESPKTLPSDSELAGNSNKATDNTKKDDPAKTPEPSPSPFDPTKVTADKINKKPLQDFADDIITRTDSGKEKIDLTQSFMVVMDGALNSEGKLDKKVSRFTRAEGGEDMVNVAKAAIEAVDNSGLFSYLRDLGVEKVNFTLIQDDKQITAIIRADQPTEQKARTVASGINFAIGIAKATNKEEDLKALIDAAKFSAQGKSFLMNFVLPKEDAHKLIDKKLQEARIKKSQTNNGELSPNTNAKTK